MEASKTGFIEPASEEYGGPYILLPHQPVIRIDKTGHTLTSAIRLVFDGAAKTGGVSLNDCLDPGPNFNPGILDVWLRWRIPRVVWMMDIEHAFLNIKLTEEDSKQQLGYVLL